ncbi:hypothetical protein J1605_010965 [Eschrichtius robustus]|uniref:THAP4-like heme-binding domain-containing protein n=1 Tax=Eschrichtius robustus TaxID=9764 RepID=A0AB34GR95_ESCRO|nr:hypothetical protein J1605_010965 [Eschrichtius robustus]
MFTDFGTKKQSRRPRERRPSVQRAVKWAASSRRGQQPARQHGGGTGGAGPRRKPGRPSSAEQQGEGAGPGLRTPVTAAGRVSGTPWRGHCLAHKPLTTEITRKFRLNSEGKLEQTVSMATTTQPLTQHLHVTYKKVTP